jgi:hypothetical protein
MTLGGIAGSVVLRDVPAGIRAILLAGSFVHVGKACSLGMAGMKYRPYTKPNKEYALANSKQQGVVQSFAETHMRLTY